MEVCFPRALCFFLATMSTFPGVLWLGCRTVDRSPLPNLLENTRGRAGEQRSQWSPPQIGFANQLPHNLRDQFLHRVAERLNLGHGRINVGRDPQTLELRMHDPNRKDAVLLP